MNQSYLTDAMRKSQKQCPDVLRVARPILNISAVDTLAFIAIERPDKFYVLSSHPGWVDALYSDHSWLQSAMIQKILSQICTEGFLCHMQDDDHSLWWQLLQSQRLKQNVLLARRCDDYDCIWLYGVFNDSVAIKDSLLSVIESLKIFSNNFFYLSSTMLRKMYQHPCFVDESWLPERDRDGYLKRFIGNTPINNFSLLHQGKQKHLTYTQAICLYQLSLGKTAKEIARMVDLSPRTVEKHFDNLKLSFNVATRKDLVQVFKASREFWL